MKGRIAYTWLVLLAFGLTGCSHNRTAADATTAQEMKPSDTTATSTTDRTVPPASSLDYGTSGSSSGTVGTAGSARLGTDTDLGVKAPEASRGLGSGAVGSSSFAVPGTPGGPAQSATGDIQGNTRWEQKRHTQTDDNTVTGKDSRTDSMPTE